mgnify:CR=1 FL=1
MVKHGVEWKGKLRKALVQGKGTDPITQGDHGIVDSNSLLKARGADQINLYQLIKYIQDSKLAYKVESYVSHKEEEEAQGQGKTSTTTPVLHTLVSFLSALTNLSTEGRIFYEKLLTTPSDIKLSYLLLSPTHAFSSIVSAARAVILAGGTMSPFDDYKAHLFPMLSEDKITTLSCGHVIPSSNLFVWTLASTRPGQQGSAAASDAFEFSFQKRSDPAMIRQLGLVLLNICSVVPDGVVVFFPSYSYLDEVVAAWQAPETQNGPSVSFQRKQTLWDRLAAKKTLFRESKGGSSDEILQQYSDAIFSAGTASRQQLDPTGRGGALLLSVVGGKLSEGINFSDRLGRCVVVVGLPYPNINSPEWKARIEYVETAAIARLTSSKTSRSEGEGDKTQSRALTREEALPLARQVARDFYENACMRAVNQSIGRAIRHRGDYAAVVLIDRRFGTDRIRGKLPGWIRQGMVEGSENKGLAGLMSGLGSFFRGRSG